MTRLIAARDLDLETDGAALRAGAALSPLTAPEVALALKWLGV